jgi:hypothetical protein
MYIENKSRWHHHFKIFFFIALLLSMMSGLLSAQNKTPPGKDQNSILIPGPTPFSLDSGSAVYCIDLLKNNPLIEIKNDSGKSTTVKVNTVWSFFLEFDENYPSGHQLRYNIIVNGTLLDWDKSFIEYGGKMINLRLLFLYRNQHPPKGLDYRSKS